MRAGTTRSLRGGDRPAKPGNVRRIFGLVAQMSCNADSTLGIAGYALCIVDCALCIATSTSSLADSASRSGDLRKGSAVQKSEFLFPTRDHGDPIVVSYDFCIEHRRFATRYRRLCIMYRDFDIEHRRFVTVHRRPIIVHRDLRTRQSRLVALISDLRIVHRRLSTLPRDSGVPTPALKGRSIDPPARLCQIGGMKSLLVIHHCRSPPPPPGT